MFYASAVVRGKTSMQMEESRTRFTGSADSECPLYRAYGPQLRPHRGAKAILERIKELFNPLF